MKQIFFSFLLSLTSLGVCPQNSLTKISIDPKSRPKGELQLSDLVESVEYIPLETNDNILVGDIAMFDVSKNHIAVRCNNTGIIYLFKRDGRFVSKIGNVGNGPGEYTRYVDAVFIEEDRHQVIVHVRYPGHRFLQYDLSGKFKGTEPIEEKAGAGNFMLLFNNHFFKKFSTNETSHPYVYEIWTRDFRLVREAVKTVPVERKGGMITVSAPSNFYVYNGRVHVRESSLNDTLYVIDKDFLFRPEYVIDAGRYKMTLDIRNNPEKFNDRLPDCVQCNRVFETKNFLLLSYLYGGGTANGKLVSHFAYYDKNAGKLLYFSSETGIPNDCDGGIALWPQKQDDNICYAFYNAYLFFEQPATEKKPVSKGTGQAVQSFDKLCRKLDPDDNPVLVIMKMK
jgi:hypothetical protein